MRKINRLFGFLAALAIMAGCQGDNRQREGGADENQQPPAEQETPVKMIEFLLGQWEMTSSTDQAQQSENRRLEFSNEGRYVLYSGGQKIDSGAYRMNEQLRNLYLESEANKEPLEYEVDFNNDQMTLIPRAATEQDVRHVYRRIGPASIPPGKTP